MEQTLVIIKSDAVEKRFVGKIITRIEELGLSIRTIKKMRVTPLQCQKLYPATRQTLPLIYEAVEKEMTTRDSIMLILEGEDAMRRMYQARGPTDLLKAPVGIVRRDFIDDQERAEFAAGENVKNRIHASGSLEEACREIELFFPEEVQKP